MLFTQQDGGVRPKHQGKNYICVIEREYISSLVLKFKNSKTICLCSRAALYANRHYLRLYRDRCPERLSTSTLKSPEIIGDVYIDPTAVVHPSAKIGPNVSIGAGAVIGAGVRIRESIILPECMLEEHCCVIYSVVGWRSVLGKCL